MGAVAQDAACADGGGAAEWDSVGNNWIADSNGDVRWYLDIEQIHDSNRRDGLGGTMGFQQTRDGKLIWGQGQTYSKFDLLGRRIWQRVGGASDAASQRASGRKPWPVFSRS